jgi:hypothetical protein
METLVVILELERPACLLGDMVIQPVRISLSGGGHRSCPDRG